MLADISDTVSVPDWHQSCLPRTGYVGLQRVADEPDLVGIQIQFVNRRQEQIGSRLCVGFLKFS